jgi:hypothetical protein
VGLGGWEGGDWGVSGGEARGPSWRGRIRGVEVEGREGVSLNRPIVGVGEGTRGWLILLNPPHGQLSN